MRLLLLFILFILCQPVMAADPDTTFLTPFERSGGKQSATYAEVTDYYKRLCMKFGTLIPGDAGITDIGLPLGVVYFCADQHFKIDDWKKENKVVILINNDIHAGEPDGVDACMMLLRDAAMGKINVPNNVVLVVIPMYNIGGALNRNSTSRANQNGPESYGFRGNARNLDLNRDFTKCDAAETKSLQDLFHKINPDLFIDNHVSDGADYQHIMTLLATQHDKLGGETGKYIYTKFTPMIYADMKKKGYDLVPYVNNFSNTPENGWREFYDAPRFGSGYAALFNVLAYVPETHMLKPFADRVNATYALMNSFITLASQQAAEIKKVREADKKSLQNQLSFPLEWVVDTTRCDSVVFKGYKSGYKPSLVSGKPRLYYDREQPFTRKVPLYNHFVPTKIVTAPKAYIIPRTWVTVISCMRSNGVRIQRFSEDTVLDVTAYRIDSFKTVNHPYERHYLHRDIHVTPYTTSIKIMDGDYIVWLDQPAKRYLVETLEPTAPDGYLAWNYFDGILQQKEYFSDYVFEDLAAEYLVQHPEVRRMLEEKKADDADFANNGAAQLDFVYRHSPWFEQSVNRYPIYRLE